MQRVLYSMSGELLVVLLVSVAAGCAVNAALPWQRALLDASWLGHAGQRLATATRGG